MLEFLCPKCRKRLRVDEGLAGRQGRCPACRQTITIPLPSEALKPAGTPKEPEDDEMPLPTEVLLSPQVQAPPKPTTPPPTPEKKAPAPTKPSAPAPTTESGPSRRLILFVAIAAILAVAAVAYFFYFR